MKKLFKPVLLILALTMGTALVASAALIPFTGDVPADFAGYPTETVPDPLGDVGMPLYAPPDVVSGWEILNVVFYLSLEDNALQVGLDAYGIAGDVDGNGTDGNTPQWLLDNGGIDYPNLQNSESMGIAFDFDQDGAYDYVAGVSAWDEVHRVCEFSGIPALPFMAFGTEVPECNGGRFYDPTEAPDYELTIATLTRLTDVSGDTVCFDFLAFGGSFEDDGVGEEFVPGTICIGDGTLTNMVVPERIELTAYPNPFNPNTTVGFSLTEAGSVTLNVYNLTGQLVNTLVDNNLAAGEHQYTFSAEGLPSGIYVAQLKTTNSSHATRLVLLK